MLDVRPPAGPEPARPSLALGQRVLRRGGRSAADLNRQGIGNAWSKRRPTPPPTMLIKAPKPRACCRATARLSEALAASAIGPSSRETLAQGRSSGLTDAIR